MFEDCLCFLLKLFFFDEWRDFMILVGMKLEIMFELFIEFVL